MVKRFLGPFWSRRKWLSKTQWYDKEKLRQIQLNRLKDIIRHSYNTVPYYRNIMDQHQVSPDTIESLDDIKAFPIMTKKDILAAAESVVSTKYPGWMLRSARTGGSTGTPLVIKRNWLSIGNEHAFVRRQWDWAGVSLSDRCAIMMSKVVADPNRTDVKLHAYDPFMRELILSTHHLSAATAARYLKALKHYRIKAIVGYPSAIGFLARMNQELRLNVRLHAALTTSELLTPATKETIASAFRCRVFDFCGSAERVYYIHTCEKGTYHIIPEYGYTELIPADDPDSDCCRVISTGFWNYAMPLIRYDTGDLVVRSKASCSCGRNFPAIESIDGRAGDVIKTPSGRRLGVTLLMQTLYVICGTSHILESQIIQDAMDHLTIKYVPTRGFSHTDVDEFSKRLSEYVPRELSFDFQKTDAIERTVSGKVRPLVSLVG